MGNISRDDKSSLALIAMRRRRKPEIRMGEQRIPLLPGQKIVLSSPILMKPATFSPSTQWGPQFGNNSAHLRPQVAFIRKAPPLSSGGEGLTGEAAGEDGDCFKSCFLKKRLLRECGDVPELRHIRPVPLQDGIGVVRPFTLADGLEPGRLRRQVQTANAGEQGSHGSVAPYLIPFKVSLVRASSASSSREPCCGAG